MTIEVVRSGVPGLDNILKGGIKKKSSVLVSGVPGSGKTMIGLQFIYYGATQFGESGIYITSEETENDLRAYAHQLGMNWIAAEQQNKIFLVEKNHQDIFDQILPWMLEKNDKTNKNSCYFLHWD